MDLRLFELHHLAKPNTTQICKDTAKDAESTREYFESHWMTGPQHEDGVIHEKKDTDVDDPNIVLNSYVQSLID